MKINVRQSNVDQLADPHAGIHQRWDDHHVLKIFRPPDHLVIPFEFILGGDIGQFFRCFGHVDFQFRAQVVEHALQVGIVWPLPA